MRFETRLVCDVRNKKNRSKIPSRIINELQLDFRRAHLGGQFSCKQFARYENYCYKHGDDSRLPWSILNKYNWWFSESRFLCQLHMFGPGARPWLSQIDTFDVELVGIHWSGNVAFYTIAQYSFVDCTFTLTNRW